LNRLGVVGRGWLVGWLLRVDSGSLVGHIGNIAVIAVGSVGDVLDSAIGKSHGVRSGDIAGTIGLLLALEVGLGVVISHGVSEGVGGDLIGVLLGLVSRGSVVSGSNLDNGSWGISWGGLVVDWGRGISRGSMDGMMSDGMDGMMSDRMDGMMSHGMDGMMDGMMGDRVDRGVMGDRGNSVVRDHSGVAYWDWPVGSNGGLDLSQTLGVVGLSHGGVGCSESLGLAECSDLTVGSGDRLVRVLAGSHVVSDVVRDSVVSQQDGAGGGGAGHGQEGEADESLHICDLTVL